MTYAFTPAARVNLPIVGETARFPVRRVYCIGRNYTEHVREMGGDVERSEPIFFTKAPETLVSTDSQIEYPPNTKNVHHEVELVVAIGPDGVFGYAVGIDLTRRDLQTIAKTSGSPWDRAKNFKQSAPCSAITRAETIDVSNANIVMRRNGKIVQSGSTNQMIWSVDEIITRLQEDMDLQAGDLIFTGTPEGVGPVTIGEQLSGEIDGLAPIDVRFI
ncbi:MAG: fumarylacetoacetate hydrolase family protein [Maricaulaceae bacterium]